MLKIFAFLASIISSMAAYYFWSTGSGLVSGCLTPIFAFIAIINLISCFIPEPSRKDYEGFANRLMDEYAQKATPKYIYAPQATITISPYSRERTVSDYHFGDATRIALGEIGKRIDDTKITVSNIPEPLWFFKSQAEVFNNMGIEIIKIAHLYILRNEYSKKVKIFYSE